RTPLADGEGIGEAEALTTRDPERVRSTLQRWRLLSMPARSLVLVDTSGSMAFTMAGTDRTRIGALVETATVGLGRFPDDAPWGCGRSVGQRAGTADPTRNSRRWRGSTRRRPRGRDARRSPT